MDSRSKDTRDTRKRNKSSITPQQLIELGKLPPQAVDIEEAVLGGLMLDSHAVMSVIDIMKPEVFYKEAHQRIFGAVERLFQKAEPVDILTTTQELKRTGELEIAGGAFYVTQLTNRIASTANIQVHARIVLEKYIQRELIRISTDTLQKSYEDTSDVFELLRYAEENIFSISNTNIKKTFEHIKTILARSLDEIEAAKNQEFNGVPSGFTSLDRITGGWQKSDLIILAARPGNGKTSFCVTTARNAAVIHNKPVAIFSLEMSATQLVNRLISSESEINADRLRQGDVNTIQWQQIHKNIGRLAASPIYIDDTPALSIFDFRAKAKRLKQQHDVAMIIVDYLQLMVSGSDNKFGNREQEVSLISRTLKSIAKELDIPIIALSQMGRSVEQRQGKRPQLSDLRESGAIEQDADIVIFIYRPFISGVTEDENGVSTEGMAEIIIEKHRNGKTGSVNLAFIEAFAKFAELGSEGNSGAEFKSAASYSSASTAHVETEEFADSMPNEKIMPNTDFLNQGPNHSIDNIDPEIGF